jgi:hypothetical protein
LVFEELSCWIFLVLVLVAKNILLPFLGLVKKCHLEFVNLVIFHLVKTQGQKLTIFNACDLASQDCDHITEDKV